MAQADEFKRFGESVQLVLSTMSSYFLLFKLIHVTIELVVRPNAVTLLNLILMPFRN